MAYNTSCPSGFVMPDYPDDPANWYVNRSLTRCAVACDRPPIYNHSEWGMILAGGMVVSVVGGILSTFLIVIVVTMKETNKLFFALTYGVLGVMISINRVAWFYSSSWEEMYCASNSTLIDPSQGLCLCSAQSFCSLYTGLALNYCWLLQSVGICGRLFQGWKEPKLSTRKWHCAIITLLPLVSCFGLTNRFGYFWGFTHCSVSKLDLTVVVLLALPLLFSCIVGGCCLLAIVCKIVYVWVNHEHTRWNFVAESLVPIFPMMVLMIVPVVLITSLGVSLDDVKEHNTAAVNAWGNCVFKYYDGYSDRSFARECGEVPPDRYISLRRRVMIEVTIGCGGVLLAAVHTPLLLASARDLVCKSSSRKYSWPWRRHQPVSPHDSAESALARARMVAAARGELSISASSIEPPTEMIARQALVLSCSVAVGLAKMRASERSREVLAVSENNVPLSELGPLFGEDDLVEGPKLLPEDVEGSEC